VGASARKRGVARYPNPDRTSAQRNFAFQRQGKRRDFQLGILSLDYSDALGGEETAKALEEAVRVLRRAGMKIAQAPWPDHPYTQIARTILGGEVAAARRVHQK
jgi:Asp-tRNA(Asn)/Glu-tRNA(Gln) amidotransferase A subunit family amidase